MTAPLSPPHPRGSTPTPSDLLTHARVSPAPAGIDPGKATSAHERPGLPRTRGDRPLRWTPPGVIKTSPPHPRGSTQVEGAIAFGWLVSPAPAGIDPRHFAAYHFFLRLPRTRGDRPDKAVAALQEARSPPHPRGSTRTEHQQRRLAEVSPAPAGIDLVRVYSLGSHSSLPRTRGDRPPWLYRTHDVLRSPPHPRGSTLFGIFIMQVGFVSPAPAGIDLPLLLQSIHPESLPRTRGDRPDII